MKPLLFCQLQGGYYELYGIVEQMETFPFVTQVWDFQVQSRCGLGDGLGATDILIHKYTYSKPPMPFAPAAVWDSYLACQTLLPRLIIDTTRTIGRSITKQMVVLLPH